MGDFEIIDHGSVWSVIALSDNAKEFARRNLHVEAWQGIPENFSGDWRPIRDLALRLQNEGWDVRDGGRHY